MLYLIFILHQSTTAFWAVKKKLCCILSSFYIKPQLHAIRYLSKNSCILSSFYIKPQPPRTTANTIQRCILSSFYIKPQLRFNPFCREVGCILSSFYIKPQLEMECCCNHCVVSYLHFTSNHNLALNIPLFTGVSGSFVIGILGSLLQRSGMMHCFLNPICRQIYQICFLLSAFCPKTFLVVWGIGVGLRFFAPSSWGCSHTAYR